MGSKAEKEKKKKAFFLEAEPKQTINLSLKCMYVQIENWKLEETCNILLTLLAPNTLCTLANLVGSSAGK